MRNIFIIIAFSAFIFTACDAPSGGDSDNGGPTDSDIQIVKSNPGNEYGLQVVYVTVINSSNNLCSSGNVEIIYYDKADQIVGTGDGTIINLPAHKTQMVKCIAMNVRGATRYEANIKACFFR